MKTSIFFKLLVLVSCSVVLWSCSENNDEAGQEAVDELRGTVSLDGSSTVYPISEAIAEEFLSVAPRVRVTVGVSGTGGGFKKFLSREIDINDASRVIKNSEVEEARANGIDYLEIPVAFDGLSVVVNPNNTWVDYLTVDELRMIWQPGSMVDSWDDIRPNWPQLPISCLLYTSPSPRD